MPQTVVAEVGYMLATWVSTEVEARFLDAMATGDFEIATLDRRHFTVVTPEDGGHFNAP